MPGFTFDLEQLRQKCFQNEELVENLIHRFEVSLRKNVAEISEAVEHLEYETLEKLSHRLTGEAGTMCAWKIHATAQRLCDAARSKSLVQLSNEFEVLSELTLKLADAFGDVKEVNEHSPHSTFSL